MPASPEVTALYAAALAAEDAWDAALVAKFGKAASDARYQAHGRGEPGSELNALWAAKTVACDEYFQALRDEKAKA